MFHDDINKMRSVLLKWYASFCRDLPWRHSRDVYAIWISEVMLQQTQVKTVIPYYYKFMEYFPTLDKLASSDLEKVLKVWEGLGYYARARNLHRAANLIVSNHNGHIPNNWKEFRALPGVGDYIAAAVLSIAFNQPYAVVDGNVKRVLARLYAMPQLVNKSTYNKIFQNKANELISLKHPGTFNQAIMELGALICTPHSANCAACPLCTFCKAFSLQKVEDFPKRDKKQPTPQYNIAIGVIRKNGKILITRRKPDGLLGGLWEFPGGKVQTKESVNEALIREVFEETALSIENLLHLTQIKHAYSHFKIKADIFICDCAKGSVRLNGPTDYRWIYPCEIDNYPFPKANLKFIPLLLQRLEAMHDDTDNSSCSA